MRLPTPFDTPFDSGLAWNHRFASLGEAFYTPVMPTPLPAPYWVGASQRVAHALGLPADWHTSEAWLHTLIGNQHLAETSPLASVYSGHQFGVWAGQLGDGRALLLGETASGLEIQLKGAGLTPYSRMGDGRAVLRSSIREFLCSEAMHGLGIPTSRALCVIGSDAPVRRETLETAAVVTRVAPSFIRFGHFEHFCHSEPGAHYKELRTLADFVIDHFYPTCRTDTVWGNPYAALLQQVTERTAQLLAHWQSVGFCHGVMNTDNMSILGLTLDYGPFQMLDGFDPGHICNHSDHQGRYAFAKQPQVAYWNLFCLGHALMPLIENQEHAMAALDTYKTIYPDALAQRMAQKLGFEHANTETHSLTREILTLLAKERVDYTIFWRRLSQAAQRPNGLKDAQIVDLMIQPEPLQNWLQKYEQAIGQHQNHWSGATMLRSNPKFVLRNHLAEQAIARAQQKDFTLVAHLLHILEQPFEEHLEFDAWADFPPDWAASIAISCSS